MNIRAATGRGGFIQMKASFKKNAKHYFQEALGLAIFMISACLFGFPSVDAGPFQFFR